MGPAIMIPMSDEHLRERKVDGKRVYDGKILALEVDEVELPSGRRAAREVVRHAGAAVMLPLMSDGRIALVRQHRYPTGEVLLELPAGKLDRGEDPEACARREIEEETGLRAERVVGLGAFYAAPGYTDELLHAFLVIASQAKVDAHPDPDEVIEVVPLTLGELRRRMLAGEIRDAKTLATLALAEARGLIGDLRPGSGDHGEP